MPLDPGDQTALFLPADVVRSTSKTHRRFELPRGVYALVTTCDEIVNPTWYHCQPLLAPLLALLRHESGPISVCADCNVMGLVVPAAKKSNQYAIALETGAEGKTDLETLMEAGPGHQDGERFLTIISLLNQSRLGAWKRKKRKVSAWMSNGLIESYGTN